MSHRSRAAAPWCALALLLPTHAAIAQDAPAPAVEAPAVAAPASSAPSPIPTDAGHRADDTGRVKVLVLPPDFKLFQLGASAVTTHEVPEWSKLAESHGLAALRALTGGSKRIVLTDLPEVSADEQAAIDQHLALADTVGYTAFLNKQWGGKAFAHKQKDLDYTLGPGLAFLAERGDADLAVFTVGVDAISTGGRVGMMFLAAAAGVAIPMGQTFMIMGVFELKTGRILWLNHTVRGSDFREAVRVYEYIDALICAYPKGSITGDRDPRCGRDWMVAEDGAIVVKPVKGGAKDKKKR